MRQHSELFYEGDQLLCDKIGRYVKVRLTESQAQALGPVDIYEGDVMPMKTAFAGPRWGRAQLHEVGGRWLE